MKHILVIEPSWKVTLTAGLYILNHIHKAKGGCTPRTTIHLLSTYGIWSENISQLFASPQTYLYPRIKPKAQYIILGPCPYNRPSKPRVSFYPRRKVRF